MQTTAQPVQNATNMPASRTAPVALALALLFLLCACGEKPDLLEKLWGLNWSFSPTQIEQALAARYTETFVTGAGAGTRIISGILKENPPQVVSCRIMDGRLTSVTETVIVAGTPDNAELANRAAAELARNMAKTFGLKATPTGRKDRYLLRGDDGLLEIGAYRAPSLDADARCVVAVITRESPAVNAGPAREAAAPVATDEKKNTAGGQSGGHSNAEKGAAPTEEKPRAAQGKVIPHRERKSATAREAKKESRKTAGRPASAAGAEPSKEIEETIEGITEFLKELKR